MPERIGRLFIDIEGRTERLENKMRRAEGLAQTSAQRISNTFKRFGAALGIGAGFAVLANEVRKGVQALVKFDEGMRNVNTVARVTQNELNDLSAGVLDLSTRLGTPTSDLTGAMYQAVSAGVKVSDSLKFMEVATKGAIAGITSTETAVDGLTTVLNAFGIEAARVTEVSDLMFTTIRLGKTTAEELAQSYNVVASIASVAGINFKELSGAIATLTVQGVPTAIAMTQLRAVIIAMNKNLGDGWRQTMTFQEGLEQMVKMSGGSQNALKTMIGRVEGVNAVLGLTGKNAETFTKNLNEMEGSAGATEEAFAEMEKSLSRKLQKISTFVENKLIVALGEVTDIFVNWGEAISKLGENEILKEVLKIALAIANAPGFGLTQLGAGSQTNLAQTYDKLKAQVGEAEALKIMFGDLDKAVADHKEKISLSKEEMEKYSKVVSRELGHWELIFNTVDKISKKELNWEKITTPMNKGGTLDIMKYATTDFDKMFEGINRSDAAFQQFAVNNTTLVGKLFDTARTGAQDFAEEVNKFKSLEYGGSGVAVDAISLWNTLDETISGVDKKIKDIKEPTPPQKMLSMLEDAFDAATAIDLTMKQFPKVTAEELFETLKQSHEEAEALKLTVEKFPDFVIKGKIKIDRPNLRYERFALPGSLGLEILQATQNQLDNMRVPPTFHEQLQAIVGELDLVKGTVGEVDKAIEALENLKPTIKISDLPELEAEIARLNAAVDFTDSINNTLEKLRAEKEYLQGIVQVDDDLQRKVELINAKIEDQSLNEADVLELERERAKVLSELVLHSEAYLQTQKTLYEYTLKTRPKIKARGFTQLPVLTRDEAGNIVQQTESSVGIFGHPTETPVYTPGTNVAPYVGTVMGSQYDTWKQYIEANNLVQPVDMSGIKDNAEIMRDYFKEVEDSVDNVDQKFISILNAGATLSSILEVGAHTFIGILLDGLNKANMIANSLLGIVSAFTGGGAGGLLGFVAGLFKPEAVATGGGAGYGFFHRQEGGKVEAGQAYVVGEKGPELFVPKESGKILPNRAVKKEIEKDRDNVNEIIKQFISSKESNVIIKRANDILNDNRKTNKEGDITVKNINDILNDNRKYNLRPRAGGGIVDVGKQYLVGEAGGEIFIPNNVRNYNITPAMRPAGNDKILKQVLSALNAINLNVAGQDQEINLTAVLDGQVLAESHVRRQNKMIKQGYDLTDF